jgi:TonB family protein
MEWVFASVSTIFLCGHKLSAHKIHHADSYAFSTDGDERTLTKKQNIIYIMPYGGDRTFDTEINLPVASVPAFTLQIADRCLLAIDKPQYPHEALIAGISGTVGLSAQITKQGMITDVSVPNSNSATQVLTNAAVANLTAWHEEPSSHDSAMRITYSYTITSSLPAGQMTHVEYKLPDDVVIEALPPN